MAFGDNAFGDNKPSVGRRGRGNRGGMGGGNNRNRHRNRNQNTGGGGGGSDAPTPAPNPFDTGDVSAGDPFGDATDRSGFGGTFGGAGSVLEDPGAAGDPANWREFSTGILNQGGISNDRAFGSQQGEWLDGQMQDWYDQWQGQGQLAGDDAQTWDQFLYGIPGTPPPGTTPGTLNTGPAWMAPNQLPEWAQTSTPGGGGVTQDWLQNTWGPDMRQYLTARYQAQTPRQRGTQSSAWTGPRRVIQF